MEGWRGAVTGPHYNAGEVVSVTPPTIKKLLLVCAGNICRTPMAEALFSHRMKKRPLLDQITVESAGTIALDGNFPCRDVVELMQLKFGMDISGHRARFFTTEIAADLILTMDQSTTDEVKAAGGTVPVEMLGNFVGTGEEVHDPYGGPPSSYRRALCNLDRLVTAAIDRVEADAADC